MSATKQMHVFHRTGKKVNIMLGINNYSMYLIARALLIGYLKKLRVT